MDKIELRKIGSLRLHPDNVKIFGLPTDEPNYEEIREDIRRRKLQEPLIILDNGTILSGHVRYSGVWWSLEQDGLTSEQIKESLIPVRVHLDFASKEEEIDYLMSANEKRRQMDPRRIATSFESCKQILESNEDGERKKGDAFKKWAERFGVTSKLATTYCTIFGSKLVPEEYKDKVNSKSLSPTIVLEAIKFAEESAQREKRAPAAEDVVIYLKNPKTAKSTLASTIREAAKTVSTTTAPSTPTPAPKTPEPKPAVGQQPVVVQQPVAAKEPVEPDKSPYEDMMTESHRDLEPVEPLNPTRELLESSWGVHISHCCSKHGCKYSDHDCPVANGKVKQSSPCEECGLISEGYYDDEMPDEEKIPYAHRLLKASLGTVTLDDELKSELVGIHTELTSYLRAMKLIDPSPSMSLPTDALGQISLCTSLVECIGDVLDPQATRDALLDLVSLAKISIERLTTTKRKLEPNGLFCPECLGPQFNSPSGATCAKGHGGLTGITEGQRGNIEVSQELTATKFKCCFCGQQVEALPHATHANCPKCGLVDTSDIEPLIEEPPRKEDEIDTALLDEVLVSEPEPSKKASSKDNDISADELDALLGNDPEPPPTKKVEPKKAAAASAATDSESEYVTSVITDFIGELEIAGMTV